jgi:hypothetical protein
LIFILTSLSLPILPCIGLLDLSLYPFDGRFLLISLFDNLMFEVQLLSTECCEDMKRVQDALQQEEVFKQFVEEKTRHPPAVGAVKMSNDSLTREASSNLLPTMKAKFVDALLSSGKTCRRYSRHEIEIATDYFSDARKIGEGGYGNVYRCTLDHTEVAVKVIQEGSRDRIDEFLREVYSLFYFNFIYITLVRIWT